uniref:Uncharacterized protein n=1 Tax=Arundo donax TaxID=35708 RepID=A0A0A9BH97_ARUDO
MRGTARRSNWPRGSAPPPPC